MPEIKSIDWVSIAPWSTSGYGQQTSIQTQMLARDCNVQISAISGLQGTPQTWEPSGGRPIQVWNCPDGFSFIEQYLHFNSDVAITLFDLWAVGGEFPDLFKYIRTAPIKLGCWMPIDCEPLAKIDELKLRELGDQVTPIAMSRHGAKMLKAAGFSPLYIPHSIDTDLFKPVDDKRTLREKLGLDPNKFIIGMNAANTMRKAWDEQLTAFKRFHARHPNSHLLIHSAEQRDSDDGINLIVLLENLGLNECIGFTEQFSYRNGLLGLPFLAKWYNAIDVLSLCSYGEGFGIPIIEAQACGVPVIVNDASAMTELSTPGWQVSGQPYWNAFHNARLMIPDIDKIDRAYENAYREWQNAQVVRSPIQDWTNRQQGAREFALRYDMHRVYDKFWRPALARLGNK